MYIFNYMGLSATCLYIACLELEKKIRRKKKKNIELLLKFKEVRKN